MRYLPGSIPLLFAALLTGCWSSRPAPAPDGTTPPARPVQGDEAAGPRNPPRTLDGDWAALARGEVPGFAGLYFEGCDLVVALTDTASQGLAAHDYAKHWLEAGGRHAGRGCPPPSVRLRGVEYDFAQLAEWKERAGELFTLQGITSLDASESTNRLVIGVVDAETQRRAKAMVPALRIPPAAVVFERGVIACARPGMPSVVVTIRDQDGEPAAIGATVRVRSAQYEHSANGFGDPLHASAGESRGGTFEVHVSRPWHEDAVVRSVEVPEDPCGIVQPGEAEVVLRRHADAPPVRQVVTPPVTYAFGLGNMRDRLFAFVVAAPGVSRDVVWSARDTSVIHLSPDGTLTTRCRPDYGTTWAVANSVVDPAKRDSIHVVVYADREPGRCPGS
jgi:hypothetical protein